MTRRRNNDTPEPETTVTLNSPEFIDKLTREYCENTKAAQVAFEEAQRAFGEASRHDQQAAELGAKQQAVIAKIQQLQAETDHLQAQRSDVASIAERARNLGTAQMAKHESHAKQATAARTVMEHFKVPVPEDTDPAVPPVAAATRQMLAVDAGVALDPRLDGPMGRFNEAHDEDPAGTPRPEATS